ncbi:response regulator [Haloferax larsenii]|uniref:histidine kinase n=1 Tax=Haloferax larsenii TaxID=302484 RepID=A0ABY5RFN9_HALLR|nr:ATP-binding protein [Haloferax larsenii]UVE50258.1 response regulator [Haloferax larsenii]
MSRDDSLSILIVDDSAFFVSLLADKLESNYGMTTTMATNAGEAMLELNRKPVDCIVSDFRMPETDGLELYEMVDEQYDIPFILLTGEGGEEIASRAIRMGIDEYLMKQAVREDEPLELLVNRIRNVVEQRRTQRKYERLVDNSPDEIGQISVTGEILAANETMATAFGVSQDELVGKQLSEFIPDDVAATRLKQSKRAITAGSAVTFQDSIGVRHFHNIAVPLSTAGEVDSVQLVTREITLQKRNEQELEQKTEKLTMINRIVRHDINNDVQLLMGWADIIRDHVDEAGMATVDRIDDTSSHIAELTAIARDFVESLEDDTEIDLEFVNLGRTIKSEVDKKRTAYEDATFVVDELPVMRVRANELLTSVFGNILSNAIRHNDSAEPEVHVDFHETESDVVVEVADNGPGVPDDRKEEIFGKGRMGPKSPGTGVGLHLVYTLVDQYGGDVWVEDNEPRGSIFVVKLPKPAN